MDVLCSSTVSELLESRTAPCISLYMPAHRPGEDRRQSATRLNNLLNMAEQQLSHAGFKADQAALMLASARELAADPAFWNRQSDGLALFISRDRTWRFRLPILFDEVVMTGGRFHLKPLLPLLTGDGLFYVLAVSPNHVRVLRCTRTYCEDVQTSLFPQNQQIIRQYIHQQQQPGRATPRTANNRSADSNAKHLLKYFREVVAGLRHLISDLPTPLIFAGFDDLYSIFQQANQGLNLLKDSIPGNPDEMRGNHNNVLHQRAWSIVEPHFLSERRKAAELVRSAAATAPHRAARTLDDAVRAAHDGRIQYLFVDRDEHRWGRLDPATGKVQVHDRPQSGDEDLLDFAATSTLAHRGTVYTVDHDEMPDAGGAPIAALLRS